MKKKSILTMFNIAWEALHFIAAGPAECAACRARKHHALITIQSLNEMYPFNTKGEEKEKEEE